MSSMYDTQLVKDILQQVLDACNKVIVRFEPIDIVSDFTDSSEGMEKLDAICMQLIAIGESLKNIDKITQNTLLTSYPEIDWKGVKGLRDIITHQYFDIDAEEIYNICKNHMNTLANTVKRIISDFDINSEIV